MRARLGGLVVLTLLAPWPAQAAVQQSDLMAQGYRPVDRTRIKGVFTGCEKGRAWTFEDGTSFSCVTTRHAMVLAPTVQVLRGPDNAYVVLIDGRIYAGPLAISAAPRRTRPISANEVEDELPQVQSGEPEGDRVEPVEPVYSLGQLREDDHLQLNDAQRYPPPERPAAHDPDH